MKKTILFILTLVTFCTLIGCGSTRQVTQLVREVQKDTIYLSSIQFDSIYVNHDLLTDRSRDTILIKETNIEYRYKLLRDTVRLVQRDSIPYEVTVIQTQQVKYIPWWAKALSAIGAILLTVIFISLIFKLAKL